ncbi:MAG: FCD domain-containing protein [Pseudomonadota bacterium]
MGHQQSPSRQGPTYLIHVVENVIEYSIVLNNHKLGIFLGAGTRRGGICHSRCFKRVALIAEIQRAYDEMAATDDWVTAGVEHDLSFHRAVAGATDNTFMLETVMFIAQHLKESIRLTRASNPENAAAIEEATLLEHLEILQAIREGDPQFAHQAMSTHIVNAAARIGLYNLLGPTPAEEGDSSQI